MLFEMCSGENCEQNTQQGGHVVHNVAKYRKEEQKLDEQDKNIQRKLAQLQLGELQEKGKAKTQAVMVKEHEEDSTEDPRGETGDKMLHPEYWGDVGHVMNLDIVLKNVSKGSIPTWGERVAGPGRVPPEVQLTRQILATRGAQRALQGRISTQW
ncbi:hypothetical protein GOODEAATRI_031774 [Goodea atripinnis]|uniref:Uncharacterized protein n=1 Tax=Goodea atripinnis TaxID=208336 RepID=A0ABV0MPA6_9TELE